jgi:hypothetical protein
MLREMNSVVVEAHSGDAEGVSTAGCYNGDRSRGEQVIRMIEKNKQQG